MKQYSTSLDSLLNIDSLASYSSHIGLVEELFAGCSQYTWLPRLHKRQLPGEYTKKLSTVGKDLALSESRVRKRIHRGMAHRPAEMGCGAHLGLNFW